MADREGEAGPPAPVRGRLSRRALRKATLPEILEWLGLEQTEAGLSQKEALGRLLWQEALKGKVAMIRLVFEYLASKPPERVQCEVQVQPMLPFTADEAAEAARQLEGEAR